MSIKALVVFKDGSTRTVEVGSPAPRDLQVWTEFKLHTGPVGPSLEELSRITVPVTVFRPAGSDVVPIYEQP